MSMKKLSYLIILLSIILVSCEEDKPVNNNDSVLTKANIRGSLGLYDEFGKSVSSERMFVYMEGNEQIHYTESEKDGSFLVPNVPYFNNYTISYEKEGFGTYKSFGYEHEYTGEEGQLEGIALSQKSGAYCTSLLVIQSNDTTHFHLGLGGSSDAGKRKIRLLFHTIPEINHDVFSHYTTKFTAVNTNQVISLSKEFLNELGLVSGTTYFVQAYGDSYFSNAYFDDYNRKQVLPNLGYNPEEAIPKASFIMP